MIDIVDIKIAVKNGEIKFFKKGDKLFCEDSQSGECVCVSDGIVSKDKKRYVLPEDKELSYVITLKQKGKKVYFKYLCAGHQGKYDGEILVTSDLDSAAKYTRSMVETQIGCINYSLNKNPGLSDPSFEAVLYK